jgi:hypothetical protein
MSFVSNGGKFKLYTVLNGLIFPTPLSPGFQYKTNTELLFVVKENKNCKMRVCGDGIFFGQLSR